MNDKEKEILAFLNNLQDMVGRQTVRIVELETLLALKVSELEDFKNTSEKSD
jgi:hypothetical protein